MRKLRMDLNELLVESLTTSDEAKETGTVQGYATFRCSVGVPITCGGDTCMQETCFPAQTCTCPTSPPC
jgi:hypothetical protein